jgi:hypothetical protein
MTLKQGNVTEGVGKQHLGMRNGKIKRTSWPGKSRLDVGQEQMEGPFWRDREHLHWIWNELAQGLE